MKTSILEQVLLSLVPYTKQNLMLTLHPKKFFYELERASGIRQQSISRAIYRARDYGYVDYAPDHICITDLGQNYLKPLLAKRLLGGVSLMVVFDIPEKYRGKRNAFRAILRQHSFQQVQKSVWVSEFDHEQSVRVITQKLRITSYVRVYECINK